MDMGVGGDAFWSYSVDTLGLTTVWMGAIRGTFRRGIRYTFPPRGDHGWSLRGKTSKEIPSVHGLLDRLGRLRACLPSSENRTQSSWYAPAAMSSRPPCCSVAQSTEDGSGYHQASRPQKKTHGESFRSPPPKTNLAQPQRPPPWSCLSLSSQTSAAPVPLASFVLRSNFRPMLLLVGNHRPVDLHRHARQLGPVRRPHRPLLLRERNLPRDAPGATNSVLLGWIHDYYQG